jgi:hypothetical protein
MTPIDGCEAQLISTMEAVPMKNSIFVCTALLALSPLAQAGIIEIGSTSSPLAGRAGWGLKPAAR